MLYRTFGKTGEKVSVLGYGNMRLPVVNNDYGVVDVDAAMKIVRHAIDNGVNYLDTSWPYHSTSLKGGGSSEPFVGKVLKEVGRDKVFVATKLPIWLVKSREDMDSFLEKQLERLGTDYVDFYLVHMINSSRWANLLQQNLGDFLDKALASGKVRYVGFSFHDKPALFDEVLDYYDWSFCQHVMNYYDVNFQAGLASLRKAHARGLGVVAMEPVMGGLLADALPEGAKKIFAESGIDRSPAAWSLRWGWDQPELSLLLSGMSTMAQVEENLRLAEEAETPLTCEELAVIDKVRKYLFDQFEIPCTQCNLCSCPHYIAIRDNFTIYSTTKLFNITGGIHDKNYDLMLRNSWQEADLCLNCGKCDNMCPQGIDIPTALRKVKRYYAQNSAAWGA